MAALTGDAHLALAKKLDPDGGPADGWQAALVALADDEFERLASGERRAFFADVLKRELGRAGVSAGVLGTSGLGTDPAAKVLAQLRKDSAPAVDKALARLRSVAVDCLACETLTLARFKSEDDRCRTCGELLPVAATGRAETAEQQVAQLLSGELPVEPAPVALDAPAPIAWELVHPTPDLKRLLALAPDNPDWDDVLAERQKAEDDRRRREEEARLATQRAAEEKRRAEEAARKAAEEAARRAAEAARKAAEEAARKAAEEKQKAEEAKRKAEEDARKNAEDAARAAAEAKRKAEEAKHKAEEEARKKAEDAARAVAEAKRKADDEARLVAQRALEEKRKAEEAAAAIARRQAEEEAARKAAEQALLAKAEAEAAALRQKAEEDEKRRREEQERLAIGVLSGPNAGKIMRIDDLDPKLKPSGKRPLVVMTGGKAKILVPTGTKTLVNDKPVTGIHDLAAGDVVRGIYDDDDLSVIEANGDLEGVNADPIHFKRADSEPGGPWNYWNEPIRIGHGKQCEVYVGDRGVDEVHATVASRFGRVVIEDACKEEDGLWINGLRVRAFIANATVTFHLGSKGPGLKIVDGTAEVKPVDQALLKSPAMKPARYVRTVMHVQAATGEKKKIFLFARREVRFGRLFSKGDRVENDLVISPVDDLQEIADKQGSFSLTRDGVTVRLDDKRIGMTVNDEDLKPGQTVPLKRRFTIEVGTGITLEGEVFRAPSAIPKTQGPGQLGVEGGHPYECVRMVRDDSSNHTYVFLVRQIRLGSSDRDSVQLPGKLVGPGHAMLQLQRGVLQIVAPREQHKVKIDGQPIKTGEPHPLKLGSKVLLGDCLIRFEVVAETDFAIQTEEAATS